MFQLTHPVWGATLDVAETVRGYEFQSTHPVWGATDLPPSRMSPTFNFNPRTPCGVRHKIGYYSLETTRISIHAPRVGCDCFSKRFLQPIVLFQSTHPVWGATVTSLLS